MHHLAWTGEGHAFTERACRLMVGSSGSAVRSVCDVLAVVRDWTRWYIQTEIGFGAIAGEAGSVDLRDLPRRDVTSMVGIGGGVNACVAISFDGALIDRITAVLTDGLDVADMEPRALREDAAGEVANTIAGNSTTDLADGHTALSLTPPVAFANTKSVCRDPDAICCTVPFQTDGGALDVTVMYADRLGNGVDEDMGDSG
jgi:CheY-specific phosphatase CheX